MFSNRNTWWGLAVALLLAFGLGTPRGVHAQISVVVASGTSYEASEDDVKRMFMGQVTSWPDGSKVQLVDQAETSVGSEFYSDVLGASPAQVRRALTALLLSGQIPQPQKVSSDAEVKAAVARLGGSIGYIASGSLDGSVREILRIQ